METLREQHSRRAFLNLMYIFSLKDSASAAHPQVHFQLAAPLWDGMQAAVREHSDVTEILQTQTVNSTL